MPNIYLTHPKHGAKVATSADEARSDMAQGWKMFTPGAAAPAAVQATVEPEAPVVNALPTRRGRARKPIEPQEE